MASRSQRPQNPIPLIDAFEVTTLASLPDFDKSSTTRNICITGLIITWIALIASIIVGSKLIARSNTTGGVTISSSKPTTFTHIGFPLLHDIGVAFSTECMGFIHTVSFRWGLFHQGRLKFNSNLRLFSAASGPNEWIVNAFSIVLLIMTYCTSSRVFPSYTSMGYEIIDGHTVITYQYSALHPGLVNGVAVTALGSLVSMSGRLHTWSSNPLNNTLAELRITLAGSEEPERQQRELPTSRPVVVRYTTAQLKRKQHSTFDVSTFIIMVFIWFLGALTFVWAILVLELGARGAANSKSFAENVTSDMNMLLANYAYKVSGPTAIYFIACTVQALYTIGLHLVELLVNFSRDEDIWRRAAPSSNEGSCQGARLRGGPITAAISNWQTLTVFAFKPTVHWLFGLSISFMEVQWDGIPWFGAVLAFRATPTVVFAGIWILLTVFAMTLASRKPRGYQPAAWGRLPLLEKLIGDWSTTGEEEDTRLWWGD